MCCDTPYPPGVSRPLDESERGEHSVEYVLCGAVRRIQEPPLAPSGGTPAVDALSQDSA